MINLANCLHCGHRLLAGSRVDAQFCSGACRVAHHRAVGADAFPFARHVALIASLAAENASPGDPVDVALQRVEAAEKQLQAARREASKAFEAAAMDTDGMFGGSVFVPRKTAKKWLEQAKLASPEPKISWEERKNRRFAFYAKPAAVSEPEDAEARERAVAVRFNAATPEERAKMIGEPPRHPRL